MPKTLLFSEINGGAGEELVQEALTKVISNILDRNTSATAKRSITVKIDCIPGEEREDLSYELTVTTKLAGAKGVKGRLFFGVQKTRDTKGNIVDMIVMKEHAPIAQEELFEQAEPENVTPLQKAD